MSEQSIVNIQFPAELKELVMAKLYQLECFAFQEGGFGTTRDNSAPDTDTEVHCYFADVTEAQALVRAMEQTFGPKCKLSLSSIAEQDWKERWKEYCQAVEISPRLLIRASFHPAARKPGQEEVVIDPELAFGTGSHPTTKLCLEMLSEHFAANQTHPTQSVLDVGCGSGILSIAAEKLGATSVHGIDIDPAAVEVSKRNAALNAAVCCSFSTSPLAECRSGFDLVFANILSGTLLALWPELLKRLNPGARLVVSGLLAEEQEDFLQMVKMNPVELREEDGWLALLFLDK